MGKKKSVVLMTFITIVILVLCAVVAFPKVTVPGSNGIEKWNPAVMQYDLGSEFSGGHYAYYYPDGVITEAEYQDDVELLEGEEKEEYEASYVRHGNTGLYLSTDEEDGIFTEGNLDEVSEGFKTAFKQALALVNARFAARADETGSTYRVAVVDDYAIRVDLSASENSKEMTSASYASQAFSQYANVGALTFKLGEELVDELKDDDAKISDLIDDVYVKTQYEISYVKITFTDKGEEMIKSYKNSSSEDASTLGLYIGESKLLDISKEVITDKNEVELGVQYQEQKLYAETVCVLINSAMEEGGVYINGNETTPFRMTVSEIRTHGPIYGDTLVWVYVGILALIVLAAIVAIVKMGGFGTMNVYVSLFYLAIVGFCYAFISGGVFVVSLASIFLFLAGLAIVNVLHVYIYNAIKAEAQLGKTVASSIKGGYKKTLWTVIDVYAVLALGAVALLIGVASLNTIACQALVCILTGAFCNLLLGRFINLLLFSASKDKYKYFRLVREDDDDEE